MPEQQRVVIAERPRDFKTGKDLPPIYHLPVGPSLRDAEFQPVRCGGGIAFHGHREKVARSKVCPDCLAGRTTI